MKYIEVQAIWRVGSTISKPKLSVKNFSLHTDIYKTSDGNGDPITCLKMAIFNIFIMNLT